MLDLERIREKWLRECGVHDAGLVGMVCSCPAEDYRHVMLDLVEELKRQRELLAWGAEQIPAAQLEATEEARKRELAEAELAKVTAERDKARGAVLELGDAIIRANGWEPQNGVTVELSSALERLVVQRDLLREGRDQYKRNWDTARREAEQARADRNEVRELAARRESELIYLRRTLDTANATNAAAQRIVTAALADGTATITPAAAPDADSGETEVTA